MSGEALSGIRVVLDLSSFFDDMRQKCYFYINFSQNKIISDVHYGIQSCFGITNTIALKLHDCYLPGNVDVHVLYNEDVIKVIDAQEGATISTESEKKRKYKKCDVVTEEEEVIDVLKRKKKEKVKKRENVSEVNDSVQFVESELFTGNKRTASDCTMLNNGTVLQETLPDVPVLKTGNSEKYDDKASKNLLGVVESKNGHKEIVDTFEFPDVETRVLDPDPFVIKALNVCDADKFPLNHLHNNAKENKAQTEKIERDTADQGSSCKKRRRRRRKNIPKDINLASDHNYSAQSLNVTSVIVNGLQATPKHIKFTEDDEEDVAEGNCANSNDCQYDNSGGNYEINGSIRTPLSSNPTSGVDNVSCWKNQDNSQSKRDTTSASTSSSCADNSELICGSIVPKGNSTPLIFKCKRVSRILNSQPPKKEMELNFSKYPVLQDCPKVNDIIAFKKWKMDANYCPGVSDYISAKVLKISEEGTVDLKILNGHAELKEPQGKFSLTTQENGDNPEETVVNNVCMNIADLLEIRLIFP